MSDQWQPLTREQLRNAMSRANTHYTDVNPYLENGLVLAREDVVECAATALTLLDEVERLRADKDLLIKMCEAHQGR